MDPDNLVEELLANVDQYINALANVQKEFQQLFVFLGRARYYDDRVKLIDMRPRDAVTGIKLQSGKFVLTHRGNDVEKDVSNKEGPKGESQVRNRKQKESNNPLVEVQPLKDPLEQFGGFVSSHLKDSRNQFNTSLKKAIELINIQRAIQELLDKINTVHIEPEQIEHTT